MQKINEKSDENSNKPSRSREGTQTSVAFSFVAILESSCRGKQIQIPPFTEMRRWKEYHALDLKAFAHYVMKAHTAKKTRNITVRFYSWWCSKWNSEFRRRARDDFAVVKAQKNVAAESDSFFSFRKHILCKLFSCNKQTDPQPRLIQNRGPLKKKQKLLKERRENIVKSVLKL